MTTPKTCTCPKSRHAHGTPAAYKTCGCRCHNCRMAYSAYRGNFGKGLVDVPSVWTSRVGTRRRLEALHCIGWTDQMLAHRLGMAYQNVGQLRTNPSPRILVSTATRIAELYDELWDERPTGFQADRARRVAAANGWLPPLAFDDDRIDDPAYTPEHVVTGGVDEVAVQRAMDGHAPATLTKAERELAVKRLTDRGLSDREIARRVAVTERQVSRDRAA